MNQKKEKMSSKIKASFTTRKFRGGAYATTLSVMAIAVVIVINLLVSKLDIQIDMTSDGKYSLSEQTVELLENLNTDITIYYLVASGEEYSYFDKLFTKYDDYSDKVTLEYKDPVLHPKFAAQYVEDEVTAQSFLVVNEKTGRAKYVPYADLIVYEFDYSSYNYALTGLDVEGQLDAAIQYVSNENPPKLYAVTGHGEVDVTATMKERLEKGNVTVEEVQLITLDVIPEDCDILFLYQPETDYTEEEAAMVIDYLTAGGNALINVNYITPELPNFYQILTEYGVIVEDGLVLEASSSNYVNQRPYQILPSVYTSEITDSVRNKKYVLVPYASGMTLREDMRDTISATNLLSSSDTSYIKALDDETLEKQEGDKEGSFYLGLQLTEEVNGGETRIALFSGWMFFDDSLIGDERYGNGDILMNTINTFADQENAVSVAAMSLAEETVTLTSAQANQTAIIVAVLIPLLIIGIGVYVVVSRRKK